MEDNSNEEQNPSKLRVFFKKVGKFLNNLFFPSNIKCVCCGKDLKEKQNIEFCEDCMKILDFIEEDKCCTLCGTKLKASNLCTNCKSHKREFKIARAVFSYEGDVARLIAGFKYNNKPYLKRTFGAVLAKKFEELKWDIDLVIPIPMTKKKKKTRGYNQAELIAEEFCKHTNLTLCTNALVKLKDTVQQARLGFKDRQENIKKSFAVMDAEKIKGKNVLLIDDVLTTGATSNACSMCLKKAGVKDVYVLTIASTPRPMLTTGGVQEEKKKSVYGKKHLKNRRISLSDVKK